MKSSHRMRLEIFKLLYSNYSQRLDHAIKESIKIADELMGIDNNEDSEEGEEVEVIDEEGLVISYDPQAIPTVRPITEEPIPEPQIQQVQEPQVLIINPYGNATSITTQPQRPQAFAAVQAIGFPDGSTVVAPNGVEAEVQGGVAVFTEPIPEPGNNADVLAVPNALADMARDVLQAYGYITPEQEVQQITREVQEQVNSDLRVFDEETVNRLRRNPVAPNEAFIREEQIGVIRNEDIVRAEDTLIEFEEVDFAQSNIASTNSVSFVTPSDTPLSDNVSEFIDNTMREFNPPIEEGGPLF